MQRIGSIVDFELIVHPIDSEFTACYAVGISPGDFAHTGTIANVVSGIGIAECHIFKISGRVGHHNGIDTGTQSRQFYPCSGSIGKGVDGDFASGRGSHSFRNFHPFISEV